MWPTALWRIWTHRAPAPGRRIPRGAGRVAVRIGDRLRVGKATAPKQIGQGSALEGDGSEGVGRGEGHHFVLAVDGDGALAAGDRVDRRHAADQVEGLPGRIHLEGPDRGG